MIWLSLLNYGIHIAIRYESRDVKAAAGHPSPDRPCIVPGVNNLFGTNKYLQNISNLQ